MSDIWARKLGIFSSLSEEEKSLIIEASRSERNFVRGQDIIQEGEDPTDVHLVASGLACRYKLTGNGQRQIVAFLLPGDICDLYVFILNAMDHSIAALAPTRIVNIPRDDILRLLDHPGIAKALLMSTLVDEAILREWIINIGQRPAAQRIAHLFCELQARLSVVGLSGENGFDLYLIQEELADAVGLSLVHVNRSLQQLRQARLIDFRQGRLSIENLPRLRAFSDFRGDYLHLRQSRDDAAVQNRTG